MIGQSFKNTTWIQVPMVILDILYGLHVAPSYIQDLIGVTKGSRTLTSNEQLLLKVPETVSVSCIDRIFSIQHLFCGTSFRWIELR